LLEIS